MSDYPIEEKPFEVKNIITTNSALKTANEDGTFDDIRNYIDLDN